MHFDRRLWALTAGSRVRLAAAVAIGLLAALAGVIAFAFLGVLVATVVSGASLAEVLLPAAAALALLLVRPLLQLVRDSLSYGFASELQVALRERMYSRLLELGPSYVGLDRSGRLAVGLVSSVEVLEVFFGRFLTQLFIVTITPVLLFAVMAVFDLEVALAFFTGGVLALVVPLALRRWYQSASLRRLTTWGRLAAEFIDSVQGIATLKSFGQGRQQISRFTEHADDVFHSTIGVMAVNATTGAVATMFTLLGAAVAFGVAVWQVGQGTLTTTGLLVVAFVAAEAFKPIRDLTVMIHAGLLGVAAADEVDALLTAPVTVGERKAALPTGEASISFEGVTHCYPGRPAPALDDLTLRVGAGERIGIVGRSGAGKSTLVWLLLRLYDPQRGRVLIGGRDVRDLSFADLRRQVAVVPQDPYLFYGTIAENLRLARPDASPEDLEAAARTANAHEFIARLPDGYDTMIGERGARLSGGERQRIAIARAVLRDAPILVLDEALSSIDARNEEVVVTAIRRLIRGRTTLIIAHRLSSVIATDRIVVLDRGRSVESGTHAELLARGGQYAHLMADQAGEADPAAAEDAGDRPESGADTTVAVLGDAAVPAGFAQPLRLGWLVRFIRKDLGELSFVLVLALFPVSLAIGCGLAAATAFAEVLRGRDPSLALTVLVGLAPLTALATFMDRYAAHDLAYKLLARLRVEFLAKLEQIAPAYLTTRRSGDLLATATQDIELIEVFYAHTLGPMLVILVPTAIVIALAIVDARLGLVLAPLVALAISVVLFGRDRSHELARRARAQLGELNAHVVETLQGMRDVLAVDAAQERRSSFSRITRGYAPTRLAFNRARALQTVFIDSVTAIAAVAVTLVGALLASEGRIDRAWLPLIVLATIGSFLSVSLLAGAGRQMTETLAAARRLGQVHDAPVPVLDGPRIVGAARRKEVRFETVRFRYPGTSTPALDGVTFRLAPGRTTALVGPSGAGKTTIAHLLLRFWDPNEGAITLDGVPLHEYKLDALRETIALVSQDTYLFNATVRDNLLIARADASEKDLEAAIARSGIEDLLSELPEGLDTKVGERGIQLSGGQRQRIAIARAFLKESPILVLDEATSHLDAVNERLIRTALLDLASDRTTLVIAHRLSTVRRADEILVLDNGRIVQAGTHQHLAASAGLYASLVSAQIRAGRTVPLN